MQEENADVCYWLTSLSELEVFGWQEMTRLSIASVVFINSCCRSIKTVDSCVRCKRLSVVFVQASHEKKAESIVLCLLRANKSRKQVFQHASHMICIQWVVSWLKSPADGSPALSDYLLSHHCRPLSCKPVWHGQLTQITVVLRSISHLFLLVNGFDRCWKV